jgi:hypothetical protein
VNETVGFAETMQFGGYDTKLVYDVAKGSINKDGRGCPP